VFLLDDADALSNSTWAVVIRAYDSGLKTIKSDTYSGSGSIDGVRQVGTFRLGSQETKSSPLFTVVEIRRNNQLTHRSYYWSNFEQNKDCLFNLPTTTLSFKVEGTTVTLTNSGGLPAVAAHVLRPSHLDTFTADDNYFWLEPGESREIAVSDSQGLVAGAWNAGMVDAGGIRASREE
jgi:beta-mannosidase